MNTSSYALTRISEPRHLDAVPEEDKSPAPPSQPPQRRRRGLSLRSSLFAKTARPLDPLVPAFELSDWSADASTQDPPRLVSREADDESLPVTLSIPSSASLASKSPFWATATLRTRSSSLIGTPSPPPSITALTGTSFSARRRGSRRARFGRYDSRFLRPLVYFKEKLFSSSVPPSTRAGREIPCCTDLSKVNAFYSDEYYDDTADSLIDERTDEPYIGNTVTSSKYTLATFLPKQLKAQFSKVANCYFMTVAIMQMIPTWSTTGHYTTIIPLLIFMSISIIREGVDDLRRHGHDKEENSKRTRIVKSVTCSGQYDALSIMTDTQSVKLSFPSADTTSTHLRHHPESSFANENALKRYNLEEKDVEWSQLKVGDIVRVNQDEWVPADLLLLSTYSDAETIASESNEAYVETMALDGETNLKPKFPPPELHDLNSACGLKAANFMVTVEDPNADLYNFKGSYNLAGSTHPLGPENVIYRGSALRNTHAILGLVIFTGEESKIRMNNIKSPRIKAPKLQRNINFIVLFMVCVVIVLAAFSTAVQRSLYHKNRDRAWYLLDQDAGVAATLMGFIIMYNTLIPLSLYVTMEIIKVMQLCFLQYDIDMYDPVSDTPADAKTATILEELGQVSHIFTDKTGTLTDNVMIFRKFSVCGVSWLHDLDLLIKNRNLAEHDFDDDLQLLFPDPLARKQSVKAMLNRASLQKASRLSTTSIVRNSIDIPNEIAAPWSSTAQPFKPQNLHNTIFLLKYVQRFPHTLFASKVKFFLLCVALCNTCLPKTDSKIDADADTDADASIDYQAASPDELALVRAARDLGFVIFGRQNKTLTLKVYPNGFGNSPKLETYSVLDIIEFSSARKRMSVVIEFPDKRICVICKGADSIIIDCLKQADVAREKAKNISINASDRKQMEADIVIQSKMSQDLESRKSVGSLRKSLSYPTPGILSSIDNALLSKDDDALADVASMTRKSLHFEQAKRYSLDQSANQGNGHEMAEKFSNAIPADNLLINDEYVIEKTLEHIEEFSTEGLRTLMYGYRWMHRAEYDGWSEAYNKAKTALDNRAEKVEAEGEKIEYGLDLLGVTAIEDKLQDGVSEAIEKLRRAGIKLWMLTGDKRETAINIGYSCRLIKDFSEVFIISDQNGDGEVLLEAIASATSHIQSGRVAHSVLVIDGGTLAKIEKDASVMSLFVDLSVIADSTICCRASPSQKASMVSAVRARNKKSVTLAIGDGANDIAMIQSADIGIGITGKEGLQAARSADYSIAQFRFLLKLLLVNGRYNYVRTSKFVLCTFYKELLFYLTQCAYQRNTLFSGSSMYESWSLSMFNTLFTSLAVICVGMFDKDLKPSTLLAVPELYSTGRLYRKFNLSIFVYWMILAAMQSVAVSFMSYYVWGFLALRDNTTFPLGSLCFVALCIIINAKCVFIEMHNRQWLAFASFIILVGGLGLWNVVIMQLYKPKESPIFFVANGLFTWGQDRSWWASLLVIFAIPIMFDIILKLFKFIAKPSDDEIFRVFEKDMDMRRIFEQQLFSELKQGWTLPRDPSTTGTAIKKVLRKIFARRRSPDRIDSISLSDSNDQSAATRKRAGTDPNPCELEPSGEGKAILGTDFQQHSTEYEILPSGKMVRIGQRNRTWSFTDAFKRKSDDEDVDAIIAERLRGLENNRSE